MQQSQASMQQLHALQQQSSQFLNQNQNNHPGLAPPRPPTAEPTRISALPPGAQSQPATQLQQHQPPPHPIQPGPVALPKGPNIAKKFNKGPSVSASSPAAQALTPPNHAPTPAASTVADSPSAPKSPLNTGAGKPAGKKKNVMKPPLPPKKTKGSKPTPVIPHAEIPPPSRPGSKRGREGEENQTGADAAAASTGPAPKRVRVDPRDELDAKRDEDAAAASTSAEAALAFLDVSLKELEASPSANPSDSSSDAAPPIDLQSILRLLSEGGLAGPTMPMTPVKAGGRSIESSPIKEEGIVKEEDFSWAINDASFFSDEPYISETPDLLHSTSSQGPTPDSQLGDDAKAPTTEPTQWWDMVGISEGKYFIDDSDWKWEGDMKSESDWPIIYPDSTLSLTS